MVRKKIITWENGKHIWRMAKMAHIVTTENIADRLLKYEILPVLPLLATTCDQISTE